MPSAYLQWGFHSGERVVARGPLVSPSDCRLTAIFMGKWLIRLKLMKKYTYLGYFLNIYKFKK